MAIQSDYRKSNSQILLYLRAYFNSWVSLMSGFASIVFTVWGLWTEADNAKMRNGLFLTVAICFIIGSYRVWVERNAEVQRLHREIDLLNDHTIREFNEIKTRIIFSQLVNDIDAELNNLKTFLLQNPALLNRKDISEFYKLYIYPYDIHLQYGAALELKAKEYQQIKKRLNVIDLSSDEDREELLQRPKTTQSSLTSESESEQNFDK